MDKTRLSAVALCAGALLAGVLLAAQAAESPPPIAGKRFARAAARAMEEHLAGEKLPYRLGLFDVNEDGVPELIVLRSSGWGASAQLFDLTVPDPAADPAGVNWPVNAVENVYVQRGGDGVRWRIEGDDSHGFSNITGDNILFDITPNITMWPHMPNALGRYLESLEKVRALPVRLALPGHRHTADLGERIQALFTHHRNRVGETLAILQREPGLTAYETASRMHWDIKAASWAEFPLNQKWFATGEALAHLEYLMEEGQVTREPGRDGVSRYVAVG